MLLNKENILAAQDLKTVTVSVPEWGGDVIVRMMTGADRDAFEQSTITIDEDGKRRPNLEGVRAKLVALTMVDEAGQQMFTLDEVGHLAAKSAAALDRVFAAANRINGLGMVAGDEAVKN